MFMLQMENNRVREVDPMDDSVELVGLIGDGSLTLDEKFQLFAYENRVNNVRRQLRESLSTLMGITELSLLNPDKRYELAHYILEQGPGVLNEIENLQEILRPLLDWIKKSRGLEAGSPS